MGMEPAPGKPSGHFIGDLKASNWFETAKEFQQLCLDARSLATAESAEEFTHDMLEKATKYGLETYLSFRQLKWLCQIADWEVPERRHL